MPREIITSLPDSRIVKTYRYRVKDKHAARLDRMARAVSFVWNFCNETQRTAVQRGNQWPSHFDLARLTAGTSKDLGLLAVTIDSVCSQYVVSRRTARRRMLRFRGKRSLGWVPFRSAGARHIGQSFRFAGAEFGLWMHRALPEGAKVRDGSSFSCDARRRWYLNLVVELPRPAARAIAGAVGVDLGLKSIVTVSNGDVVAAPQHYRSSGRKLAVAQRARKRRLVRTVTAKIGAQRRDFLHKLSTRLVGEHGAIYVGDVSSVRLAKTRFAKSVLDAGWSSLRMMLRYKSDYAGIVYREVNEMGSTVTCSDCGSVGGPKGREGLVVREWTCGGCGVVHDRDVNAARNILRFGCEAPTGARPARVGRHHKLKEGR